MVGVRFSKKKNVSFIHKKYYMGEGKIVDRAKYLGYPGAWMIHKKGFPICPTSDVLLGWRLFSVTSPDFLSPMKRAANKKDIIIPAARLKSCLSGFAGKFHVRDGVHLA